MGGIKTKKPTHATVPLKAAQKGFLPAVLLLEGGGGGNHAHCHFFKRNACDTFWGWGIPTLTSEKKQSYRNVFTSPDQRINDLSLMRVDWL